MDKKVKKPSVGNESRDGKNVEVRLRVYYDDLSKVGVKKGDSNKVIADAIRSKLGFKTPSRGVITSKKLIIAKLGLPEDATPKQIFETMLERA